MRTDATSSTIKAKYQKHHRGTSILIVLLALFLKTDAMAEDSINTQSTKDLPRYQETTARPHDFIESFRYVSIIYVVTTAGYLYISQDEVFHNASLQNYARNFGNMTFFDEDLPSANWGVHLLTGSLAYEFYRGRSYSLADAFFMTLIQECLFQFTVETMIQPTGLENVANTTIVGSLIGRGLELASLPLLNSDFWLYRGFGYVLNLPALFGLYEGKVKVMPVVDRKKTALNIQIEF